MQPQEIARVQASFRLVQPIVPQAAALFYGRLFALDPTLRPMFPDDMQEQGHKLMTMLAVVVKGLSRLDTLVPTVQALGRRHAAYGVTDAHYATVGAALLWTLEQGLGAAWTREVEAAWVSAYTLLSTTMQAAVGEHNMLVA